LTEGRSFVDLRASHRPRTKTITA